MHGKRDEERVVVTGMEMLTCLGSTREAWPRLLAGESGIGPVGLFDVSRFRCRIGGIVPDTCLERPARGGEADSWDRSSRLVFSGAKRAVAQAGLSPGAVAGMRTGVVLGTTLGGMRNGELYHRALLTRGPSGADPRLLLDYLAYMQGRRLAAHYGIRGPVVTVSNACSSGTCAIGMGFEYIRLGVVDRVIAGGYDTFCEFTHAGFDSLRLLDPEGCRPFDRRRQGLVLGEGAGFVVLERLSLAKARGVEILGEVLGYGSSSDAHHTTKMDPTGEGPARAIRQALDSAGLQPRDIHYINAHGTGTPVNDAVETRALKQALGEAAARIPLSSSKSMIGHLLGASGAVEAVITLLALREGIAPPTAGYREADPACDLDCIPNQARRLPMRVALSNSFGFGGNNACLVLARWEEGS